LCGIPQGAHSPRFRELHLTRSAMSHSGGLNERNVSGAFLPVN
jgi:hypothetical protein